MSILCISNFYVLVRRKKCLGREHWQKGRLSAISLPIKVTLMWRFVVLTLNKVVCFIKKVNNISISVILPKVAKASAVETVARRLSCVLYYQSFMIVNYASVWSISYNRNLRSQIRLALGKILNYDRNRRFIVLANVIMIVNYDRKTFIVQATGVITPNFANGNMD